MFDSFFFFLIPVLVPMVIAGVKKVQPSIPKVLIPLLAPVLGVVASLATDHLSYAQGAFLGALGIAVREVVDQVKKFLNENDAL